MTTNFELELFGESIHDGDANAVETTGNLVALVVEFSPRMKSGHDHLCSGTFLGWVFADRDAATIVNDSDAAILVNDNDDFLAEATYGFIDRVIHDLVDEVMQTIETGRPNVHSRAFSNRIKAFENLDSTRVIVHNEPILGRPCARVVRGVLCWHRSNG